MTIQPKQPGEVFCIDTSSTQTEEGQALVLLAIDAYTGKVAHIEVQLMDKPDNYVNFIQNLALRLGFESSPGSVELIVNLEPGNERMLLERFVFLKAVHCDLELCRSYTDPAWDFISRSMKDDE